MANYVPRLTADGIYGNYWWYSDDNPYTEAGFGMPNCTTYAYGRWGELRGAFNTDLGRVAGTSWYPDAKDWYANSPGISRGSVPQLGAVICYGCDDPQYAGHVAVVEVINEDGSIVTSNSGYESTYFWTYTVRPEEGYLQSYMVARNYYCQGFLYLDTEPVPPQPPVPVFGRKKHRLPIWMYFI